MAGKAKLKGWFNDNSEKAIRCATSLPSHNESLFLVTDEIDVRLVILSSNSLGGQFNDQKYVEIPRSSFDPNENLDFMDCMKTAESKLWNRIVRSLMQQQAHRLNDAEKAYIAALAEYAEYDKYIQEREADVHAIAMEFALTPKQISSEVSKKLE